MPAWMNVDTRMRTNRTARKFVAGVITLLLLVLARAVVAQPITRPFPFTLSSMDTASTTLLPSIEPGPAGKHGVWHLSPEGHFVAADGTRVKFFGTEIQYTANFIDGTKALILAKRLRKMGFNALRLNYVDYFGWDEASIFHYYQNSGAQDTSSYDVNPVRLAQLDTLLATLKSQGIYVFLTLNSAHHFAFDEGVPTVDSMTGVYGTSAIIHFLYPQAEWLEHKWARAFTSHINPLTGIALGKDPAIACFEILQDQTMPFFWRLGRLNYVDANNALDRGQYTVSYHQSRRLDTLFSGYLLRKYGSDAALNSAWAGNQAVNQTNLIVNPSFETFDNSWNVYANAPVMARQILVGPGVDGQTADLIHITNSAGTSRPTDILFYNNTARCGIDTLYQLSFWAKVRPSPGARVPRSGIVIVTDQQVTSLQNQIIIDTAWQQFTFSFRAQSNKVEYVGTYLSGDSGDVVFDNFILKQTPEQGLKAGETLSGSQIQRLAYDTMQVVSVRRARDETMFFDSLQRAYYGGMVRLLRDSLSVAGLVNTSQANYWGTILDYHAFKVGEVTETHTGWDYVSARGSTPYSDSSWMIRNYSMVKDNGFFALALTAAGSTAGKAHILGQWSVPIPNQNASEQAIIPVVYAAYQDWDGIFFSPYAGRREELFTDTIVPGYQTFAWNNISSNHALMAQMPLASYIFRNGLVPASNVFDTIEHDADDVNLFPHYPNNRGQFGQEGYNQVYQGQAIMTSIGVRERYDAPVHQQAAENLYNHVSGDLTYPSGDTSSTNRIVWNPTEGTFMTSEPHAYAFTGYITDSVVFPKLMIERLDQSHDNLSFDYVFSDSMKQGVFSVSTRTQNTGTRWIDTVGYGKNTGHGPTIMSAANLRLTFTSDFDTVRLYGLDSTGAPSGFVTVAQRKGRTNRFLANIDQQATRSVWYLVEEKAGPVAGVASSSVDNSWEVTVSPNPTSGPLTVGLQFPRDERASISVIDDLGREVRRQESSCFAGLTSIPMSLDLLPKGHYMLRVSYDGLSIVKSITVIR